MVTASNIFEDRVDEIQAPETDFASIYEFKGKTYWGDDGHAFSFKMGSNWSRSAPWRSGTSCMRLTNSWWLLGWKEVFLFDGDELAGLRI